MSKKWKIFQTSDEYMAQVAHDARAPLAALKFVLGQKILVEQGAERQKSSTAKKRSLASDFNALTSEAVQRLENILSDLSRAEESIEKHALPLPSSSNKSTLAEVISKMVGEKKSLCHFDVARSLHIQQKIDEASKVHRTAGPIAYLERCLSNIIDNAIEAVPSNRDPKIVITARCDSGEAIVSVRDNGVGIPNQIVQLLGRTPISYNKEGGSGRGLYFAYRFLQGVDGSLEIKSVVQGKKVLGTEVLLRIPLLH